MKDPRGILVLGSPRSGTTMVGNYLSSSDNVCDMGEYGGFHFVRICAPPEFEGAPSRYLDDYLQGLRTHARTFAESTATAHGHAYYLDHCPWNLLVGGDLEDDAAGALFVLMLRHPVGVVQSLARSYAKGYTWAGADVTARASLWCQFYEKALELPEDRTVAVSYDALCAAPQTALREMERQVTDNGFSLGPLDPSVLAVSHATKASDHRPTLAHTDEQGNVRFTPIAPEPDDDLRAATAPVTETLQHKLAARFGCDWLR
ncbi:sulfotransferase [Streptomyces sp. HPF1205]|uniref:sulfotransferase family protein n=1 Tax=Streptomyces sp. HPF1205 TaxID=2873262 RepID=UPI001CEDE1B6|nr:sulfotransferase [Streptomyces sp. HPF1205]